MEVDAITHLDNQESEFKEELEDQVDERLATLNPSMSPSKFNLRISLTLR